jgi:hypothetical protein
MSAAPNRPPPPKQDRKGVEGGEHDVSTEVTPAAPTPDPQRESGMISEGDSPPGSIRGGREGGMIGEG